MKTNKKLLGNPNIYEVWWLDDCGHGMAYQGFSKKRADETKQKLNGNKNVKRVFMEKHKYEKETK